MPPFRFMLPCAAIQVWTHLCSVYAPIHGCMYVCRHWYNNHLHTHTQTSKQGRQMHKFSKKLFFSSFGYRYGTSKFAVFGVCIVFLLFSYESCRVLKCVCTNVVVRWSRFQFWSLFCLYCWKFYFLLCYAILGILKLYYFHIY